MSDTLQLTRNMIPFRMTELRPSGWLKRQYEIQMNGLTGRLYDIWDSVGSYSGWLGGSGENWERGPYYLDGLLPLAYYLDDKEHWNLACRFIEWTLSSQDKSGNFGPVATKSDYWSRFAMLRALVQYGEITEDGRVESFCANYFRYLAKEMPARPPTDWSWARIPDLMYCVKWLYERIPSEEWLLFMRNVKGYSLDWEEYLHNFPFPCATQYYYDWDQMHHYKETAFREKMMRYHATHIVNVTMGLKYPAILYMLDGDKLHRKIMQTGLKALHKFHGVASGVINGDEHLSGNSPSQGAELCSVVEYMFSLQVMLEAFGDVDLADQLERLAFNALPAMISEDFMSHQYLQQANQVAVSIDNRTWYNNGDKANLFGLEPNYGCCTANMHQGWPKLLKSLWFRQEGTIVSMVFAPSVLITEMEGKKIEVELRTDYPFKGLLEYRISVGQMTKFTLKIRIPRWCKTFQFCINGEAVTVQEQNGFVSVQRLWKNGDTLSVILPMKGRIGRWYNDSISVERGPLLFGLDLKESWTPLYTVAGVSDYQILTPDEWNVALPPKPDVDFQEHSIGKTPFSKKAPAVTANLSGYPVPQWNIKNGSAAPVPQSPVKCETERRQIRLIPYGCTKLRISQFPYYADK